MLRSWSPTTLANILLLAVVILAPARAVAVAHLDPSLPFGMVAWVGLAAIGLALTVLLVGSLPGPTHLATSLTGAAVVAGLVALTTPSVPSDPNLTQHVAQLIQEFVTWFGAVTTGHQATDNRLFLLLLSEISWAIGYASTWLVIRRQQVWLPVTAGVFSLLLVLMAFPSLSRYAVAQFLAALILAAGVNLQRQRDTWASAGLREPAGISRRAILVGMPVSLALVGLGWLAPTTLTSKASASAPTPVRDAWLKAQGEFYRMFGGLRAANVASLSGFNTSLILHGSFHLATIPVLEIASSLPEYWRAITYDQYTGHGWRSSEPIQSRSLPAGTPIQQDPALKSRALQTQKITVLQPRGNYLVGAELPIQFDRPATLEMYTSDTADSVDVVSALSKDILLPGTQYIVTSNVSTATVDDLRRAGRTYPSDVRQRYLALPRIPWRVRRLAFRLTTRKSNVYDKAAAIESYLKTLTYALDVPVPPANRDGVDYFLFVTKAGYCDYFASAMAVLLRTVGIPSRVVAGYATGQAQGDATYLVQDANAHSWTEVYFPDYGWIPFDATAGWPTFPRGVSVPRTTVPATPTPIPDPVATMPPSTPVASPIPTLSSGDLLPGSRSVAPIVVDARPALPYIGGLGLAGLAAFIARYSWEKDLRQLPGPVVAYVKMTRLATLLGVGPKGTQTPREYARALSQALPDASDAIDGIADQYEEQVFGRPAARSGGDVTNLWLRFRSQFVRRISRLGLRKEIDREGH